MGTWIEISILSSTYNVIESFPAMGTWIEISTGPTAAANAIHVVPCNGNVDWNRSWDVWLNTWWRSFPAMGTWIEIVWYSLPWFHTPVVPCNGNVDWNKRSVLSAVPSSLSFPAMGTWIEMFHIPTGYQRLLVVPCNGNVDWNVFLTANNWSTATSFPAMGTWIEIRVDKTWRVHDAQSFPAMGTWIEIFGRADGQGGLWGRSLQWERGLKFPLHLRILMAFRCSLQWERGLKYSTAVSSHTANALFPCGNLDWN